jgi:hypothetical protein
MEDPKGSLLLVAFAVGPARAGFGECDVRRGQPREDESPRGGRPTAAPCVPYLGFPRPVLLLCVTHTLLLFKDGPLHFVSVSVDTALAVILACFAFGF